MSDTPRVDGAESCFGSFRFVSATFARQLERELAEAKAQLNEHRDELVRRGMEMAGYINQLAAIHAPESGVWLWQGDGSDHPESMVNSLPVVMTASTLREKQAEVRLLREQLTAHKAALEKCEKALFATWADLDHLNHWMPTPCRELYMEAKLEIAKLKGTNELQGLQEAR
mgnify:CR=1 FL=1